MKLLRYGPKGQEKPGLLAADGSIRSLVGLVDDIAGEVLAENGLRKLAGLDPMSLPEVEGEPRLGVPVAAHMPHRRATRDESGHGAALSRRDEQPTTARRLCCGN